MNWYAIYTYIRAEKAAGKAILDLGYPVFIPLEKRIRRRRYGKPEVFEAALFPRYGFVQFGPADHWGHILKADGVIDVVRSGENPCPIPQAAIEHLQLASDMGLFDFTKPKLKAAMKNGTKVKIEEGPFAGFLGKVAHARSRDRIGVLLKLLGAEREVTIPLNYLHAV